MAIQLECINFIVPISVIKKKYPGGWTECLNDHHCQIGGRIWFDDALFRDGAMNPLEIGLLVSKWQSLGFHTHTGGENPKKWIDVCVVQSMFETSTLPCDWIEIQDNTAFKKGTPKGAVIGPWSFRDD
jgi:hypothetical protein